MRNIITVAALAFTMAGCASTGATYDRDCGAMRVENRGYEDIRLRIDNRLLGTLEGFTTRTYSLCDFRRVEGLDIEALGGRYAFQVSRLADNVVDPGDRWSVVVGERWERSRWTK